MSRDDPHFRLRVPPGMRDRIAAAAKAANRSMNAEIVARLEASFEMSAYEANKDAYVQGYAAGMLSRLASMPPEEALDILGRYKDGPAPETDTTTSAAEV